MPKIAEVTSTSPDRVRDVIHAFNADGFEALEPKYAGGRPPTFDAEQRDRIKQIVLGRPDKDFGLAFATWSLSKLADYLVRQRVVDDNVELAYAPFYGSRLNRIEPQLTVLRYFTLNNTDPASHAEQASLIRRHLRWRNTHATDPHLREVVDRASLIKQVKAA